MPSTVGRTDISIKTALTGLWGAGGSKAWRGSEKLSQTSVTSLQERPITSLIGPKTIDVNLSKKKET